MQEDALKLMAKNPFNQISTSPPDKKPVKRVRKGNKIQISFTISEPLLDQVDHLAKENGQSRAGLINLALSQLVKHGLTLKEEHGTKK